MAQPLLEVRNLSVEFPGARETAHAVSEVSFAIAPGEVLGLVGESGSGKSVTALSILRLLPPAARITSGSIVLRSDALRSEVADPRLELPGPRPTDHRPGTRDHGPRTTDHGPGTRDDLLELPEDAMRQVRGEAISMIFQEPMTALNPVMKVGSQIAEALLAHREVSKREARQAALEMMRQMAIPDAERRLHQYPHQLSGGLRQRVMIAMALVCRPLLLIADEPTTALDVTVQAQILALLAELRQRFGLALLFISHDLGVVAQIADRVAVMYAGRIIEHGPVREIFRAPAHPYTRGLLRAAPSLATPATRRLPTIEGVVPALSQLPPGCAFEPRCDIRVAECTAAVPGLVEVGPEHYARCIRA